MKKLLLTSVLLSTLLVSGCFGGGTEEENATTTLPAESFAAFTDDNVVIQYPRNWQLKKGAQLDDDIKDSILAVFISNFKDPFFTPVITIERVAVAEGTTSSKFAEEMIKGNEENLVAYSEIERKDQASMVGANSVFTKLVRFRGREKLDDDMLEFIQVYLAKDGIGYIATGAYDPNDEDSEATKIVQSLGSFRLK